MHFNLKAEKLALSLVTSLYGRRLEYFVSFVNSFALHAWKGNAKHSEGEVVYILLSAKGHATVLFNIFQSHTKILVLLDGFHTFIFCVVLRIKKKSSMIYDLLYFRRLSDWQCIDIV